MRLEWENVAISIVRLPIFYIAPLNGKAPLAGGSISTAYPLPSVSSSDFTIIFEYLRTLEDVGSLEVLDIFFEAAYQCIGNGEIRFQLSGDGGQTFTTMGQATFNNPPPIPVIDSFFGAGIWVPIVESGDNKLVIRCQTRAISGTVDTILFNFAPSTAPFFVAESDLTILYRKRVLF